LYTSFVIEHVTNPDIFIQSCRSLLKPGGMFFGVTPNLWHYFGLITKISSALGIEDWLLNHLIGVQAKASYHFPTAYRLNSITAIKHSLKQHGFREVEFKCIDQTDRFESYFPSSLRWFPGIYSRLVYRLRLPHIMGLLMFKATV
jgi:SAM-dependent methyltransferase